jgi:hypothetical protein
MKRVLIISIAAVVVALAFVPAASRVAGQTAQRGGAASPATAIC